MAALANILTGGVFHAAVLFLVAAGVAYLEQTPWVIRVYEWISGAS